MPGYTGLHVKDKIVLSNYVIKKLTEATNAKLADGSSPYQSLSKTKFSYTAPYQNISDIIQEKSRTIVNKILKKKDWGAIALRQENKSTGVIPLKTVKSMIVAVKNDFEQVYSTKDQKQLYMFVNNVLTDELISFLKKSFLLSNHANRKITFPEDLLMVNTITQMKD